MHPCGCATFAQHSVSHFLLELPLSRWLTVAGMAMMCLRCLGGLDAGAAGTVCGCWDKAGLGLDGSGGSVAALGASWDSRLDTDRVGHYVA